MRLLKAFGAGLAGAVLAILLVIAVQLVWGAASVALQTRSGSGGIGAVSAGFVAPFIPAVLGFIAGAWWQLRR